MHLLVIFCSLQGSAVTCWEGAPVIYIDICQGWSDIIVAQGISVDVKFSIINWVHTKMSLFFPTQFSSCIFSHLQHKTHNRWLESAVLMIVGKQCHTFVMQQNINITHQMSKPDAAVFRKVMWLLTLAAYHNARILIIANSWVVTLFRAGAAKTVVECWVAVVV